MDENTENIEEYTEDIENTESYDSDGIDVLPENVEIIGVRFKKSGKVYYFDPCGEKYSVGDNVIVKTARGLEYGTCSGCNKTVNSREIVLPLRPVVRLANADDEARHEANVASENEALRICAEKIEEHNLDMKLVDVEYTFDNNKLLFYFTSDGRVDFRDLVKDLAGVFKTRIELRQIGIRDETKLVGGLGVCGRPFCCSSFLTDFSQVSIKMAKEQNLSLNSAKISGACGKLMCCLKYEHEVYLEEIKKTPKIDSAVTTPDGTGIVVESNPLAGLVKVKLDGEQNSVIRVYSRDDLNKPSYPKADENREPVAEKLEESKIEIQASLESELKEAEKPKEKKPKEKEKEKDSAAEKKAEKDGPKKQFHRRKPGKFSPKNGKLENGEANKQNKNVNSRGAQKPQKHHRQERRPAPKEKK